MEQISFILMREDIDNIRAWINEGSLVAAKYCLERPYIPEYITSEQANELAVLRTALATALCEAGRQAA
ncbi:hypothetical protein ACCS85_26900 [Rhizobium ruizarguesonis]